MESEKPAYHPAYLVLRTEELLERKLVEEYFQPFFPILRQQIVDLFGLDETICYSPQEYLERLVPRTDEEYHALIKQFSEVEAFETLLAEVAQTHFVFFLSQLHAHFFRILKEFEDRSRKERQESLKSKEDMTPEERVEKAMAEHKDQYPDDGSPSYDVGLPPRFDMELPTTTVWLPEIADHVWNPPADVLDDEDLSSGDEAPLVPDGKGGHYDIRVDEVETSLEGRNAWSHLANGIEVVIFSRDSLSHMILEMLSDNNTDPNLN